MSDGPTMEKVGGAGSPGFDEDLYVQKFLRHVKLRTKGDEWFVNTGKAWELVEPERFHPVVKKLLPRGMRAVKNIMAVMGGAQADRQLQVGEEMASAVVLDRAEKVVWVNCLNGLLKVGVDKAELLAHGSTAHLFSACLAAEWRGEYKDEMTPLFCNVVGAALPEAMDRALLHWFSGYLLYPSCEHEVILINYGGGGTGKSTVSDAIMGVIGGSPLKSVLSLSQLCAEGDGAYSLPILERSLVNYGTEVDTVATKDSSNIKRLASGEPIQVRSIYGRPRPMTSTVKMWFNSNTIPRFKNGTDAELRRLRFIHFAVQVPEAEKDRELKSKLAEERHGVLSWMVQGLQAILGGMACPLGGSTSEQIKDRFALANDPVKAFVEACCVIGEEEEQPKLEIFEAFGSFMAGWGFTVKAKEDLFRKLYERYPSLRSVRKQIVGVDAKERPYWIVGISLKEEYAEALKVPRAVGLKPGE